MLEQGTIKIDQRIISQLNMVLVTKFDEEKEQEDYQKSLKSYQNNEFYACVDTLRQRLFLYRGFLFKENGRFQEAAKIFIQLLQTGDYYDEKIRKLTFRELQGIFQDQQIEIPEIRVLQEKNYIKRDFVIAVYVGQSMEKDRSNVKIALKAFQKQAMSEGRTNVDQISLITFCESINIELKLKKDSNEELSQKIDDLKFGSEKQNKGCLVYDAIVEACNMLQSSQQRKYVVVITDSEDQGSKSSFQSAVNKIQNNKIMIIVISLKNHLPQLEELTKNQNYQGLYLHSMESQDLAKLVNDISGVLNSK